MQATCDVKQIIGYMPFVRDCDSTLKRLGDWWQKITLIGKINSYNIAETLLDDMEQTRRRFEDLQAKLVENLVQENVRKIEQEIVSRAQVAIDILIRNLFERTADVGFLATDDDLRAFLRNPGPDLAEQDAVIKRLHEYTAKYSVYDEIVVLDPQGNIRARLKQSNTPSYTSDPLLQTTLKTQEPYIETFGHSDLQPERRQSLIYSCRIHDSDAPNAPVLGVLCLCFRFSNEMRGIFANLARPNELLAILDKNSRVIASNDEQVLPLGTQVSTALGGKAQIVKHNGSAYIASTCCTQGYQGYFGLGWMGHVMVPAHNAFAANGHDTALDSQTLNSSHFFSQDLRTISRTASQVTDDLILIVLNGKIISARKEATEFMPVLDAIRTIGYETRAVFDNSINNLYNTVAASLLSEVQFQARLAVDIMDRNLYERANDVRWWALTTRFREIMVQPAINEEQRATLAAILSYINKLYTVYTNLFIYDTQGVIVAVSNPAETHHIGRSIGNQEIVQQALSLSDSQQYVVSAFEPTPLYGDGHSYIYHTSIKAMDHTNRVAGGIGIVFDSAYQFNAMLRDTLPRDDQGDIIDGCFGVFTDRNGQVISSTVEHLPPGSILELDERFFKLENGESLSAIVQYDGRYYAVGAAMSQGYREYKTTNDYSNDVLGLVFVGI